MSDFGFGLDFGLPPRIEALKKIADSINFEENVGTVDEWLEFYEKTIAALRGQDGKDTNVRTSGWISVEDRLPSAEFLDKEIIVCKLNRFGGRRVHVTRFWGTHSALWNDITHWMPLPSTEGLE